MRTLQRQIIAAGSWTTDIVFHLPQTSKFLAANEFGSAIELWFDVPAGPAHVPTEPLAIRVLDTPGMQIWSDWIFLAGVKVGGSFALVFSSPIGKSPDGKDEVDSLDLNLGPSPESQTDLAGGSYQ